MSMRRDFTGTEINRLIVSVPVPDVEAVDSLLRTQGAQHPARGCRSEFVRLAIAEKLARDQQASSRAVRARVEVSGNRQQEGARQECTA